MSGLGSGGSSGSRVRTCTLRSSSTSQPKMASPRPSVYIIGVGMSKFSKPAEGNDEYGAILSPWSLPHAARPFAGRIAKRSSAIEVTRGMEIGEELKEREREREREGREKRKREG